MHRVINRTYISLSLSLSNLEETYETIARVVSLFVKARARLLRLPLFLVQGTTTLRVKHADEGASPPPSFYSFYFLTRPLFGLPVVLTNQSKEGVGIRKREERRAKGLSRVTLGWKMGGQREKERCNVPFDSGKAILPQVKRSLYHRCAAQFRGQISLYEWERGKANAIYNN